MKCRNVTGGDFTRQPITLNNIRENFPYRRSFKKHKLLKEIRKRNLLGYVQCDFELLRNLRANFANFPPIFQKPLVSRNEIGGLMEKYAERERLLSQPRKTLISSFTLQNATLITPLLLFYLQLGLVCPKNYCFVEYTPNKGFNSFVQPAVDAR